MKSHMGSIVNLNNFIIFLLVFVRVSMLFVAAPVFSSREIPVAVKVGFSFFLTIIIVPMVLSGKPVKIPLDMLKIALLVGEQVIIGLVTGFIAMLIFSSVPLAASFYGFQMGFGIVNVIDPMSRGRVPITGQFKTLVVLLLFFATDAHYLLLLALRNGFEVIPISGFKVTGSLLAAIMHAFSNMFFIAIQISIPVIAVLLMIDIGLGIIAKTMPQLNVFIFGFPVKIIVGLVTIVVAMPVLVNMVENMFETMYEAMIAVFRVVR